MKRSSTTLLAGAALAGLLTGSVAQAATSNPSSNSAKAGVMAEKEKKEIEKHACKGKNSCKGQGGCKTDANSCKGKNACKGKGGCATDGSKPK